MISKRTFVAKKLASRITILSALLFLAFSAQMANATKIISVSGSLNFGDVALGTAAKRTMTIVNSGTSTLQITNILYPADFSGSPSTGAVRAGKKLNVTVTFALAKAT